MDPHLQQPGVPVQRPWHAEYPMYVGRDGFIDHRTEGVGYQLELLRLVFACRRGGSFRPPSVTCPAAPRLPLSLGLLRTDQVGALDVIRDLGAGGGLHGLEPFVLDVQMITPVAREKYVDLGE